MTTTEDLTPMSTPAADPAQVQPEHFPWLPIVVLGFTWFLAVAIELSPAGLLGAIAADLDVSVVAVGTMTTCYALGNALLVLPLTALAIRFARRTALNVVMIVFVASNLAVALAPDLTLADLGRFVGGASYAVICTLFPAVVIRIAGPRYAGKAITVVFTATALGAALGAPLGSLIGNTFGWRVTFLSAAGLAAVAGVLMSFLVPKIRVEVHKPLSLRQTARQPGVLRVAVGWSLVMLAHFVVLTYIEAYLGVVGLPTSMTSLTLLLLGVGGIVGTLFIGRISSRSVPAALVVAPCVVAAGLTVLLLGGSHLAVVLTGIALWGIGMAATVVVYQQAVLLTGHRAPETATSIGVLLAQAGFAAGATVGGATISVLSVGAIPLVGLAFVAGSIIIATTLRRVVNRAGEDAAAATEGRERTNETS
ncbi:MFS transporter [uncultured Friedmanniella sp.]|uniref:MFS transporter n=1 Tax=uncultured Friedmanniella sp. TaxID=335381 RepID=UPI0035CBB641